MEIQINEMTSTVRAVDGDAALAPQTLKRIVEAVVAELRDRDEHRARVDAERRVTGVWADHVERERGR